MNGMEALSWSDIKDWVDVTEYNLPFWNLLVLKGMSRAYVTEYHAAEEFTRPAPYTDSIEITQELRDKVSSNMKSVFAEMKSRQNNLSE